MRTFANLDEFRACEGEILGSSDWVEIDQARIDTFADATGDRQWIHVDPDRAAQGPFGATLAHGYLTLSLLSSLTGTIYRVDGIRMALNYGLNKVRFPSPVRVGSKLRATTELTSVREVAGGVEIMLTSTVEIEGAQKPACVAQHLARYYI
ncbi:MaoC family dehydratase [Phytohabitans suffuscus]|uniref:MaoC family dehydratase n=1 Tax=Phytohabitans suffuscus TaxID=624315 RepID=A0A6F8YRP3_9ACTN|nr:MaoC family dehydratase [Phytohabitans suffuscus]BCB88598.1 MaoC family dehydratase [Phytohabitans suffuscus]